jgi:hypothetical protein
MPGERHAGPPRRRDGSGLRVQAIDKIASFFQKCLYLVASKLSLEVVPFWKTQANFGDHSATMFLSVFVFFLAFSLGLGI